MNSSVHEHQRNCSPEIAADIETIELIEPEMGFWKLNHRAFIEVVGSFKSFSPKVNKFTLLLREKLQSIFDDIFFFSSEDREREREQLAVHLN